MSERLETGKTMCVGDWPGIFIRGDNCKGYALMVQTAIKFLEENVDWENQKDYTLINTLNDLRRLHTLLLSSQVFNGVEVVNNLRSFNTCRINSTDS